MSAKSRPGKAPDRKTWMMILVLGLCAFPGAALAWWQDDWAFRKPITLDTSAKGANIAQALGRTPILIRLHSGNFTFEDAKPDGSDIRFVASDDKTPLAFHIESFDPKLGVATVWIDVPEVPGGAAREIWLYYGNKNATPAADSRASFDPNYSLVYHFNDAAGRPPLDKTAFGNNAASAAIGIVPGSVIGSGARFTGQGGIVIPASSSLTSAAGAPMTFSAWVRPGAPGANATLLARREGGSAFIVGVDQGTPFVELNGQRAAAAQAIPNGQWSLIAASSDGKTIILYVNGRSAATMPGALPAFTGAVSVGADLAGGTGSPFTGDMDEVRLSKVARTPQLLFADAASQGSESRLVAYGEDEKQSKSGFGHFAVIIQNVSIDAWIVIGILGLLAVLSWWVIYSKIVYAMEVDAGNDRFLERYRTGGGDPMVVDDETDRRRFHKSSVWRIYRAGADEVQRRMAASKSGRVVLHGEEIEVIRAIMDATFVRESQRLSKGLVWLTISISGGPFLGLLGTVVGVMIVFAAVAEAGDVNVNAIAPGISAALLATVAGLGVAIPALFGYNYIVLRNKNISANMQVFVDEFITRVAEIYRDKRYAQAAE
jgi:biopolymer transport protein ExbB